MEKVNIVEKTDSAYAQKAKALAARYFAFIPPLFFIAVLALGYFLLLAPKHDKVKKEIEASVVTREQERDKYEDYFNKFSRIKQAFAKVSPGDVEKLNRFLPSEPETEKLMVELESIVSGKGLFLSSIKASQDGGDTTGKAAAAKQEARKLGIDVSVAGLDYRALKLLLRDLENNLRLLDVNRVDFSPSNGTANLSITAYYLPKE